MVSHYWKNMSLDLVIDITTYCNAKCPQCSRTDPIGLGKNDFLPLKHWTLEQIQKAYPSDQLEGVAYIQLTPTWGDSMMNPWIYDITKHFLENMRSYSTLEIVTNGSMRDEDFWWEFGKLGILGKRNKVKLGMIFDIDGITQEMHAKYRRNTNLQKVLDNMYMFSQSGYCRVRSQSIIFKHNQDYMKEIQELAYRYGSSDHMFVKSDRFWMGKKFEFINEKGEKEYLEWADIEFKNPFLSHIDNMNLNTTIQCRWAMDNTVQINFDGQVWPCCYLGNADHSNENLKNPFMKDPTIQKYNENRLDRNVLYTKLTDIIKNDPWFNGILQESINSDSPIRQCSKSCSLRQKDLKDHQVRTRTI